MNYAFFGSDYKSDWMERGWSGESLLLLHSAIHAGFLICILCSGMCNHTHLGEYPFEQGICGVVNNDIARILIFAS